MEANNNFNVPLEHSFKKFSAVAAGGTEPILMSLVPQFAYLQYRQMPI